MSAWAEGVQPFLFDAVVKSVVAAGVLAGFGGRVLTGADAGDAQVARGGRAGG